MALSVETGTGSATAESYCTVVYFWQYHSDRGNTAAAAMTTAEAEAALRKATGYMSQLYRNRWNGYRQYVAQALDWPRIGVVRDVFVIVNANTVPVEVMNACAELALRTSTAELLPDLQPVVLKKTVGPLSVEYDKTAPNTTQYLAIDAMLAPFLTNSGSRSVVGLVRS